MPDRPDQVELAPGVALPAAALCFRFARSSGPGGQNVNKLNTKAALSVSLADLAVVLSEPAFGRLLRLAGRYRVGDRLTIASESSRSQLDNRRACVDKLAQLVQQALVRPKVRRPTKPSRASKERRLKQKQRRAEIKRNRGRPSSRDW